MNGEPRPSVPLEQTYDHAFFDEYADSVRASAEVVVPLVIDLLHPTSVLDVGCGHGTWLEVFREHGVIDVVGVDGPHVGVDDLEIPPEHFVTHDLREPFDLGRRFDLVISLEVAEHLDGAIAPAFVSSVASHGAVVLFSAAIPFQGGAGHVNERWPSYWAELFAGHGLHAIDAVRPTIWDDERVSFWYAQNTLLYTDAEHAGALGAPPDPRQLDLVHPRLHVRDHTTPKRKPEPPSLSRVLREFPGAARRAVAHRARPSSPEKPA